MSGSRVSFIVAGVILSAACASSTSQTSTDVGIQPASQTLTTASGQNIRLNTSSTTVTVSDALTVGADSAYNLLLKVYKDLNIPTTTLDPRQRLAGNPNFKVRRRIGGIAMSKYLDCGNKDGVSNADEYDIVLNVASAVGGKDAATSTISSTVNGVATHPVFSTQTACSTTGELEKRISMAINAKAAGK